jgi:serine/threonine protein phosphatase 1
MTVLELPPRNLVAHFQKNEKGRDFVVGDIHGMFSAFEHLLQQAGFDPGFDRVFSVGDLIDRGDESHRVLEFLNKPWFHSIMGNHEKMLLDAQDSTEAYKKWIKNYEGKWWEKVDKKQREEIRTALAKLPIVADIETSGGKIGIVHADMQTRVTWQEFIKQIQESEKLRTYVLWSRGRLERFRVTGSTDHVDGIKMVVLGHTPMKEHLQISNLCYIDTGAAYTSSKDLGTLTLLQIEPEISYFQHKTRKQKRWFL